MLTPESLEGHFTLLSATARYDALRVRDSPAPDADLQHLQPLSREEVLEMLALGEVIARKAADGRQLSVRSARDAGASWSQIGAALGMSKQAAWEAHGRWIEEQAARHRRSGGAGPDDDSASATRERAGRPGGAGE
ncbi:hypothetical protein AB0D04_21950 [Streptomyces sp. NPDC048483]|uniref:hypothetical protein n=1 Tax=Streptomyces sp. NPDC048483 TaxID=3154927 RepID=UPI00343C71FB